MARLHSLALVVLFGVLAVPLSGTPIIIVADETARTISGYSTTGALRFTLTPPTADGRYGLPTAAGFTPDGSEIWVSDFATDTVYKFTSDGVYDSSFTNPAISHPVGIAFSGDNMVVTNRDNNTTTGHTGNTVCEFTTTGPACFSLTEPRGISVGADHVYVSSSGVNQLNAYTGLVQQHSVGVKAPRAVAIDAAGFVYVTAADATHAYANQILRFNPDLDPLSMTVFATYSGPLPEPAWNGLGFDSSGYLYISGYGAHDLVRLDADGTNPFTVISGLGNPSGITVGEATPEPASLATLGLGLIALASCRRFVRRARARR